MKLRYSPEALVDLDRVWLEVLEASQDLKPTEQYIEDLRNAVRKKTAFCWILLDSVVIKWYNIMGFNQ